MRYEEYLKMKEMKRIAKKEKVKEGSMFKSVLKVLGWIIKSGYKLIKVAINKTGFLISVSFWVMGEGARWVAWTLDIVLNKIDDKYMNKSTYKQRRAIMSIVAGLVVLGGTISFVAINGMAKNIKDIGTSNISIEEKIVVDSMKKEIEGSDKSLIENVEIDLKDEGNVKARALSNDADRSKPEFIGEMEIKSETGEVNPGFMGKAEVRYKDDAGNVVVETVDVYGSGHFTTSSKKRYVGKFMEYVLNNETDFYNEYFEGVGQPGTTTFDTAWYNAAKYKADEFKQIQYDYVFAKYVEPTVIAVKDKYGIDLLSTKAYQEFAYSTANQYDVGGTLTLFEKAGITSTMTEKEVIEKIQQEKIDSLGVYTYTDAWSYNDSWRNGIKVRCEKELSQLLEMIN